MMAVLQIPELYVLGLVRIGGLEEATLKELVQVLPSVPISARHEELIDHLAPEIKSVTKEDLGEITRTLIGLAQARIQLELDTPEIVRLVCAAMERSSNQELRRTAEKCTAFGERLTQLLAVDSLEPLAKASIILTDHACVFLECRTRTDVRAVFGADTEALPRGAAINHMLAIAYQRDGKRETFYLALNSRDVNKLRSALNRALSKEKGLKKLLEAAKVSFLETE